MAHRFAVLALALVLAAPFVLANDVPRFRGANSDGIFPETGLLQAWPEGGPKLKWQASGLGEIVPSGDFYDYDAKYVDDASQTIIPADLPTEQSERIRAMAVDAYRALDATGMARVDFLIDGESGQVYLNEVNTIPGFTTISMYSKMWEASGLEYPALLDRLIALAVARHDAKQSLRTTPRPS